MRSICVTCVLLLTVLGGCGQEFLSDQPDYPCARMVRDERACINAFSNHVNLRNVKIGQSPSQVRQALGREPDAKELIGPEVEAWLYHTDYANRMWTRVVFKQGKVVENPARVSEENRFIDKPQRNDGESATWRRLRDLQVLRNKGAITKEEYEEKRTAILKDL